MNTATVEEVQVKSNQQGLISNSEKEEQGGRADSSDSKAQSFPSDKEVSPDDFPCTNKDNSSASVGSTNLDTSTAKDFTDVDERPILKQAEPSEQVSDMVGYQGGDGYGKFMYLLPKNTETKRGSEIQILFSVRMVHNKPYRGKSTVK